MTITPVGDSCAVRLEREAVLKQHTHCKALMGSWKENFSTCPGRLAKPDAPQMIALMAPLYQQDNRGPVRFTVICQRSCKGTLTGRTRILIQVDWLSAHAFLFMPLTLHYFGLVLKSKVSRSNQRLCQYLSQIYGL